MDLSLFWFITIMLSLIYGVIWLQHEVGNARKLRTIFYWVASIFTLSLLALMYKFSRGQVGFNFLLHAIAVIAPALLFLPLLNRNISSDDARREGEQVEQERVAGLTSEERLAERVENERRQEMAKLERDRSFYGSINPKLVCPHCKSTGTVRRMQQTRVDKARVNSIAGRAVGLGTNTERKVTQMRCDACETKWDV